MVPFLSCQVLSFSLNECIERMFFHTAGQGHPSTEILMTLPTREIMKGLLADFLSISYADTKDEGIYDVKDLDTCVNMMHTINYHEERWHNGIKITCYQAGHVLGAAMFCVEIDSVRVLYILVSLFPIDIPVISLEKRIVISLLLWFLPSTQI